MAHDESASCLDPNAANNSLLSTKILQPWTFAPDFALFVPTLHGSLVCLGERLPSRMVAGLFSHVLRADWR